VVLVRGAEAELETEEAFLFGTESAQTVEMVAQMHHESKDDDRFVSASSVTLGGSYSIPTLEPHGNDVRYLVGASADFGRVTGYVVGSTTSGRGDGNGYGVTVGVRVPL